MNSRRFLGVITRIRLIIVAAGFNCVNGWDDTMWWDSDTAETWISGIFGWRKQRTQYLDRLLSSCQQELQTTSKFSMERTFSPWRSSRMFRSVRVETIEVFFGIVHFGGDRPKLKHVFQMNERREFLSLDNGPKFPENRHVSIRNKLTERRLENLKTERKSSWNFWILWSEHHNFRLITLSFWQLYL